MNDKLNKLRDELAAIYNPDTPSANWGDLEVIDESYKAGWDAAIKAAAELAPEYSIGDALSHLAQVSEEQFFDLSKRESFLAGTKWQYEQDKATIGALKAIEVPVITKYVKVNENEALRAQANALMAELDKSQRLAGDLLTQGQAQFDEIKKLKTELANRDYERNMETSRLQAELDKTKEALRLTGEGRPSEWAYTQLLNDFNALRAQADALAEALDQIAQYHSHAPELNRIFEIARAALAKYRGEK